MYTAKLAEFAAGINYSDLPEAVIEATEIAYLDWLGSALAGSLTEPGKIITELAGFLGGDAQATIIADGTKNSLLNAALVNGAISHIVELDDVHKAGIIHAAAGVIPAALAMAEAEGASGKELITAIALGYEVAVRIAEAITPSHYKMWHTTGTCCTFGAAIAAGKIIGLNAAGMQSALGSAGTQAGGLWEFINDSAMSKHLHPGKAAMNGTLAALLAGRGFTAANKILEGERGFFAATASEVNYPKLLDGLGEPQKFKILENSYKVHASCRHTHAAIDTVLELQSEHELNPADIAKIQVNTYQVALDITDNFNPKTTFGAKFSLPFCIALGLTNKRVGLRDFTEAAVQNKLIRELMARVELNVDPKINELYPDKWPVTMELSMANGEIFTGANYYPKGDPENPLTLLEFHDKFTELALLKVELSEAKRLITATGKMRELADVGDLIPKY